MTVVTTDYQTHGKGRLSRVWYGNEKSIMCSILLKEHLRDFPIEILPLLVAKILHQVLSKYSNNIKIKWPNDLWINGLKLSGILIKTINEINQMLAIIIGFGININQVEFDEEIKDKATSLSLETQKTYDKEIILSEIITQMEFVLKNKKINKQEIIAYCNKHSAIKNKEISFIHNNQTFIGTTKEIDTNGHLIVKVNGQTMTINSNEVTLIK